MGRGVNIQINSRYYTVAKDDNGKEVKYEQTVRMHLIFLLNLCSRKLLNKEEDIHHLHLHGVILRVCN